MDVKPVKRIKSDGLDCLLINAKFLLKTECGFYRSFIFYLALEQITLYVTVVFKESIFGLPQNFHHSFVIVNDHNLPTLD